MCMFTTWSGKTYKQLGSSLPILAAAKKCLLTSECSKKRNWACPNPELRHTFPSWEQKGEDHIGHHVPNQPVSNSKGFSEAGLSSGLNYWKASSALACLIHTDKLQRSHPTWRMKYCLGYQKQSYPPHSFERNAVWALFFKSSSFGK